MLRLRSGRNGVQPMSEHRPETQYAWAGDICIAYQVMGDGPHDLIIVPGIVNHVDYVHELPGYTDCLRQLAGFARVITFDKRGQGMSDGISGAPSLEQRMEDLEAVMTAIGSERATLFGLSEGGPMSLLFAATWPDKVDGLMLFGSFAKGTWSEDYPYMAKYETQLANVHKWGTGSSIFLFANSLADDPAAKALWARGEKQCTTPSGLRRMFEVNNLIDVRPILPSVRTRVTVMHRVGDPAVPVENGRYLAQHIPTARLIEFDGNDHVPWIGNSEAVIAAIREFVTGSSAAPATYDSVLATVLFADIVQSSETLARLGDHRWRELLDRHDGIVAEAVTAHRGRVVKNTGDGFLATFDGPSRAVHCARTIGERVRGLGIETRAGAHIGEIELRGDDVAGLAVNIAARVQSLAAPGQVLVTRTLTDLVPGSGLAFADHGNHQLKGIPGDWHLYALAP